MHPAEEVGYWVEVPVLPGRFSQGETVEETLEKIKEAIELHLEGLKDEGMEPSKDEVLSLAGLGLNSPFRGDCIDTI